MAVEEENGENGESDDESGAVETGSEEKEVGIRQIPSGKWYGRVSDKAYAASNSEGKKKQRCTPSFATRAEAVKARAELRDKVDQEYDAITLPRVEADPLARGLPRAPDDASTAVARKAYWVCSERTKHVPTRMVVKKAGKQGFKWTVACVYCPVDNASIANLDKRVVATQPSCTAHGGVCKEGKEPQKCMSCNLGKQSNKFCSTDCGTLLQPKRTLSKAGTGLCAGCDPADQAKRQKTQADQATKTNRPITHTSKEQFFAIANDQHFPELQHESIGGVACDGEIGTGDSRRRADLATRLVDTRSGTQFMHLDECDEKPHLQGKNCYDRDGVLGKLSGHMHDIGAPALSPEEAAYIEENPFTPEEMSGKVQNAKTRNVARVLNKVLTKQEAQMIPIRVLSVGVDGYTDSTGTKHPSAFVEYRSATGSKLIRTNPEEWAHRVECFVREKKKLLELGATGPSIVHVRLFYNESDRATGLGVPPLP